MNRFLIGGLTVLTSLCIPNVSSAGDVQYEISAGCDDCGVADCGGCCGSSGCCGGGWIAEFDAMFLRYNRADGNRVDDAPDEQVDFRYRFTPRIALGWITSNGMGIRARYFSYGQTQTAINGTDFITVNAENIDLEVFERVALSSCTTLEWSAGVRYNDFREVLAEVTSNEFIINDFDGWGLTLGLEANRNIRWGSLYARGRGALLVGDSAVTDDADGLVLMNDATQGMLEIGVGWEAQHELANGMLATLGIGYEMQNWFNYSSEFEEGVSNSDVEGRSDVGFDGFLFTFGIER